MILWIDSLFPIKGFNYVSPMEFFLDTTHLKKNHTWILAPTRKGNGYFVMTPELIEWYESRELDTFWGFTDKLRREHNKETKTDNVFAAFETGDDGVLFKLTWW